MISSELDDMIKGEIISILTDQGTMIGQWKAMKLDWIQAENCFTVEV